MQGGGLIMSNSNDLIQKDQNIIRSGTTCTRQNGC